MFTIQKSSTGTEKLPIVSCELANCCKILKNKKKKISKNKKKFIEDLSDAISDIHKESSAYTESQRKNRATNQLIEANRKAYQNNKIVYKRIMGKYY